jgi:triacylglycerol lipase
MIGTALANGWDVVVSDYEGPKSELLVGPLEGRETLDGIRAAENFPEDGLNGTATKVGLEGYSGGSVPVIWAGSLAASYAPKLHIVGVAAGGVAADPDYITAHIDHSLLFGGVILGLVGISRAYPELHLPTIFSAHGLQVTALDGRDGYGCGLGVTSFAGGTAVRYTKFSSSQALARYPVIVKVTGKLDAVSAPAPHAPVYLYNTVDDEIMRISQVDALYAAYCKAGTSVSYDRSSVGDHISGITTFGVRAPLYLAARFAGQRPPSTCAGRPNDPKQ